MAEKKFIKPSNKKLVLNKSTGKWIDSDEDSALMEMAKIKRDQAKKMLEENEDEPSEEIMCPKCFEWTSLKEPCCP